MSCPKGKIRRSAYTRKDGTHVGSTCVPDVGKPGKTPASQKVLPKPKPNVLTSKGYRVNKSAEARHKALDRVVKERGESPLSVFRHLLLIANYTTTSNPEAHAVYRRDMAWVKKKYGIGSRKSRRSRRKSRKSRRKSRRSRRKSKRSRRKSKRNRRKSRRSRRKSRRSRRRSRR